MVLILALLLVTSTYTLQVTLNYPSILLDKEPLVAQGKIAPLLVFLGLLLCGILLLVISLSLVPYLEQKRRRRVLMTGCVAGTFWAIGAFLGLALATALVLCDRQEAQPAALLPISPAVLEPTFNGQSYTTKAATDPAVTIELARESLAANTNNGMLDAPNPLISLPYADLHRLPPTLIQVGSQEVFLSDIINIALGAQAAGVPVQLEVWPAMWHTFPLFVAILPLPDATLAFEHMLNLSIDLLAHKLSFVIGACSARNLDDADSSPCLCDRE